MKKLLLSVFLGASMVASATTLDFNFAYCNFEDNYAGVQAMDTYDVAIFLPGDQFAGCKVLSVSAPLNNSGGIANYKTPKVFLTTDLTQDATTKANTPNIGNYSATIGDDGYLQGAFGEEGYTITSEGVYVGYTFTVSRLDRGTKFPISIANSNNPNALFLHTVTSTKSWDNIQQTNGWGSTMIVALQSDNVPESSVYFLNVNDPAYAEVGQPIEIPITFGASSMQPIHSIDVDFTVQGASQTWHYDLPVPTVPGVGRSFSATISLPASDVKYREKIEFNISKVNGGANTAENTKTTVSVAALDEMPVHQTLLEEYTGTWCQWCTRGYAALDHLAKNYPDYVVAAFHNNDAMTITSNYPSTVPGFPSAVLNRSIVCDPYFGTETYSSILPIVDDIEALNKAITPWKIDITHTWDGDVLKAQADVANMAGFSNQDYKIMYLLVADGLSGTTSQWNQKNAYSSYSQSSDNIEELNDFCKGGKYGQSTVKGLIFNDVVISTTGIYGVKGSIPASLEAEEVASHTQEFNIGSIKSALVPDRKKLRVIAAVIDKNGVVLNCAKHEVNDYEGMAVETLNSADDSNAPVEYYNLQGQKVSEDAEGIVIRRQGAKAEKILK